MSQSLLAASISGASAVAFFDIFAFPQAAGLVFLLLGLCGATYRLHRRDERATRTPSAEVSGVAVGAATDSPDMRMDGYP
jgi:hypothetical protein